MLAGRKKLCQFRMVYNLFFPFPFCCELWPIFFYAMWAADKNMVFRICPLKVWLFVYYANSTHCSGQWKLSSVVSSSVNIDCFNGLWFKPVGFVELAWNVTFTCNGTAAYILTLKLLKSMRVLATFWNENSTHPSSSPSIPGIAQLILAALYAKYIVTYKQDVNKLQNELTCLCDLCVCVHACLKGNRVGNSRDAPHFETHA